MLKTGIKFEQCYTITDQDTLESLNAGGLAVFSSSAMIKLMEATVYKSLEKSLDKGTTVVGTSLDVKHFCPTTVGTMLRCESELIKISGKNLTFEVTVNDDFGVVGTGLLELLIVDKQYFMMKAMLKKAAD